MRARSASSYATLRRLTLAVTVALALPTGALAATPAAPGAESLFVPGINAATPDGALSLLANPAGLGTTAGTDFRLQAAMGGAQLGAGRGLGWGAFLTRPLGPLALGAALEHLQDAPGGTNAWYAASRVSLGASLALGEKLSLGSAVRWNATSDAQMRNTWDAGLLYRPWRWLSLGARASLLGDDRDDNDSRRPASRMGVGVAVRPFSTDRLTLGLEHDTPVGGTSSTTALQLGWQVLPGLNLLLDHREVAPPGVGSTVDALHDRRTTVQMGLSLGKIGAALGVFGSEPGQGNGRGGATLALRISGDTLPSLWQRGTSAVVVPLAVRDESGDSAADFTETLLQLRQLAFTPKLRLVVLRADNVQLQLAQAEELRAAIAELRSQGKQVVWYATELGTRQLSVAAACSKIVLPPAGVVSARGVAADFVSLAKTLQKIGVGIQVLRYSEHKTAFDNLVHDTPPEAVRARLQASVERAWGEFSQAVALGRDVTPGALEAALEAGVTRPEDAQKAKLIDGVAGPDELEPLLRSWRLLGRDDSLQQWEPPAVRRRQWSSQPRIVVVPLGGSIADDEGGWSPTGASIGGRDKAKQLAELAGDDAVKGVVARINSPGGAVLGSEYLRTALAMVSKSKPVVASMGGVAASGGYWASLGADHVFADRNTITGSIGIIALRPSFAGLYDKLGIRQTSVGAGPHHATLDLSRPATDAELKFLHGQLGRYYDLFVERVMQRRKLERDDVLAAAGGRVHFGDDALRLRLVDEQGGVLAAIHDTVRRAKLQPEDEIRVEVIRPRGWFVGLSAGLRTELGLDATAERQAAALRVLTEAVGPWLDAATILQAVGADRPVAVDLQALGESASQR